MKTTTRLRLPTRIHVWLRSKAKEKELSVSALLRIGMSHYLSGASTLEEHEAPDKRTTFVCPAEDMAAFRDLAHRANMPLDVAMRRVVRRVLTQGT